MRMCELLEMVAIEKGVGFGMVRAFNSRLISIWKQRCLKKMDCLKAYHETAFYEKVCLRGIGLVDQIFVAVTSVFSV